VYDHHDLTKTFKTLLPEVKRALHTVLSPRAVNLPLHLRDGIWQADVPNEVDCTGRKNQTTTE
ncbi:type VI secretion system baseplate subunit TssK, partial [Vibrio sp. FNV 38]|nr:type VI secretion system baseplate subunit TssK [Vibrio sp. FNV 38]